MPGDAYSEDGNFLLQVNQAGTYALCCEVGTGGIEVKKDSSTGGSGEHRPAMAGEANGELDGSTNEAGPEHGVKA